MQNVVLPMPNDCSACCCGHAGSCFATNTSYYVLVSNMPSTKVDAKALSMLLLLLLPPPPSLLLIGKPTAAVPSTRASRILQYYLLDCTRSLSSCMQYRTESVPCQPVWVPQKPGAAAQVGELAKADHLDVLSPVPAALLPCCGLQSLMWSHQLQFMMHTTSTHLSTVRSNVMLHATCSVVTCCL